VLSFISGCAAANARRGYFGHCLRGVRARSERPLDSDAPSPPVPFFAYSNGKGAGGTFSDGISKKAVLVGTRRIDGGHDAGFTAGCASGLDASRRSGIRSRLRRAISAVLPVPIAHSSHRSGVCPTGTALGNNTYGRRAD
jgi:hypothetical protein